MKHIKHVIWDWNGTLWDDAGLCTSINNHMLQRRGLTEIVVGTYQAELVFPVSDYYHRIGFDYSKDPYEVLAVEFIEEYEERRFESELRDGARELLKLLKANHIPQAVLSAYKQDTLETALDHYNLLPYFTAVIGLNDVYAEGKTANGLKYIAESKFAAEEILFIGDTLHDFEVAQAMGVHTALVAGGHNSYERLKDTGAPVFHSLRKLLERF